MSASVKLLQGDATGFVSGKLLLLQINLPSPFATESEQVPGLCFETFSVFSGPVSSAFFSLEDHCCLQKKRNATVKYRNWLRLRKAHTFMSRCLRIMEYLMTAHTFKE